MFSYEIHLNNSIKVAERLEREVLLHNFAIRKTKRTDDRTQPQQAAQDSQHKRHLRIRTMLGGSCPAHHIKTGRAVLSAAHSHILKPHRLQVLLPLRLHRAHGSVHGGMEETLAVVRRHTDRLSEFCGAD